MSHMHRNVCRFMSLCIVLWHYNTLAVLSHILLQSQRGPWQSVRSRDNATVRRLTVKAHFTDISCTRRGRRSSELWLTDSQCPHQTLLVKKRPFLSAEIHQHVQAVNTRVHKTSHAVCLEEVCYGLSQPFFSKSLEITPGVSFSLRGKRYQAGLALLLPLWCSNKRWQSEKHTAGGNCTSVTLSFWSINITEH